jgi:hypothetical protein
MRRRELILLLGGAMTTPGGLRAQQKAMPVVGVLNIFSRPPAPWKPGQGPVADGLREAGYIAEQNVTFELPRGIMICCPRLPPTSSPERSM